MTTERAIAESLAQHGYRLQRDLVGGSPTLIASRGEFRWSWFATYLRLYVTIRTDPSITGADIHDFTQQALTFAKRRFRLRGLQAGVAVIPVLISAEVDQTAAACAESLPIRHFAAFAWPLVIDRVQQRSHHSGGGTTIGGIYEDWLLSQLRLISAAAAGQSGHEFSSTPRAPTSGAVRPLVIGGFVGLAVGLALIITSLVLVL